MDKQSKAILHEIPVWRLIDYLSGIKTKDFAYAFKHGEAKYKLSNPISEYFNQLNRFTFSGGFKVDVLDAEKEDPRQQLIDDFVTFNQLSLFAKSILKKVCIYGELLLVVDRTTSGEYLISYFTKPEFDYETKEGVTTLVTIETKRKEKIDKKEKVFCYKKVISPEEVKEYDKVEESKLNLSNWNHTTKPNSYGVINAIVIKNNPDISSKRGITDFDNNVIELIITIFCALFDGWENLHFFGNPIFSSPDPDNTIEELKARKQAIQKYENDEGGSVDLLTPKPIDSNHLKFIEILMVELNKAFGIQYREVKDTRDVSSVGLKTLSALTIQKAEEKWEYIVDEGFKSLFKLLIKMAIVDDQINGVKEEIDLSINRNKPYFPVTDEEKLKKSQLAQELIDLGLSATMALKMSLFPELSTDQINDLLKDGL